MDCARGASPQNHCASVTTVRSTSGLPVIRVSKLRTNGPSGSWTTVSSLNIGDIATQPPDIAINDAGSVAWITYVNGSGIPVVRRINLPASGAPTLATTSSFGFINGAQIRPVLPMRIENQDGAIFILVANAIEEESERFLNPRLQLVKFTEDLTTRLNGNFSAAPVSNVDLDGDWSETHFISSEYDFACKQDGLVARCVIVANFSTADETTTAIDSKIRSIAFHTESTSVTATLQSSNWDIGTKRTNGIIGVAFDGSGASVISNSNPIGVGTTTVNTFVHRFTTDSVASAVVSELGHRGDATTCPAGSNNGHVFGAASMHGGYSIAFCPSCATGGTLESVSWGAENGTCF